MSVSAVLFTSQLWGALLLYVGVSYGLLFAAFRLEHHLHHAVVSHWLLENAGLPLIRAFALTLFILAAYPILFGLETAPSLDELSSLSGTYFHQLLNLAFVVGFIIPFIPIIGRFPAFTLPIQAISITALLFSWLAASRPGLEIALFPDTALLLKMALMALITHLAAGWAALGFGWQLDRMLRMRGFQSLTHQALVLVFQVPVILMYTLSLGQQW